MSPGYGECDRPSPTQTIYKLMILKYISVSHFIEAFVNSLWPSNYICLYLINLPYYPEPASDWFDNLNRDTMAYIWLIHSHVYCLFM